MSLNAHSFQVKECKQRNNMYTRIKLFFKTCLKRSRYGIWYNFYIEVCTGHINYVIRTWVLVVINHLQLTLSVVRYIEHLNVLLDCNIKLFVAEHGT